jgi:hypothetical protein
MLDYRFTKVMDLDLWQQTDEGGEFDGKDNTNIFNILEEVEDINYNHVNRKKGEEPKNGEIPVSFDDKGNHKPDDDGYLRYKKPFHTTIQRKLAFLNQKHVVKHIHVEYPQEEDDENDDGPDEDPDDNGFLNIFGMNNNSQETQDKKISKKVSAIFAYVDRIDKEDESSDESSDEDKFKNEQK